MNTYQALSIATCACNSLACNQPAKLDKSDLAQAGMILSQMGATLRLVGPDDSHRLADLSEREMEVLELVAAGYTNQAIAKELYISINTVKAHKRKLIDKLGVSNNNQLIALAASAGLGR